jgi:hypothetical protein
VGVRGKSQDGRPASSVARSGPLVAEAATCGPLNGGMHRGGRGGLRVAGCSCMQVTGNGLAPEQVRETDPMCSACCALPSTRTHAPHKVAMQLTKGARAVLFRALHPPPTRGEATARWLPC